MSETIPMFTDLVLVIAVSLPVLFLFKRLGLPPIAGFILTGILIGPYGLGWIHEIARVEHAAQLGVVLLLFSIGLEVSLARLLRTSARFYIVAFGQIVLTVLLGWIGGLLIGLSNAASLVVGFVTALSSSAIVLKGLSDRGELESPLGQLVVTICLLQDFAVVPFLLIIGFLGEKTSGLGSIGKTTLQVVALGGVLYLAARYVLPRVIRRLMTINTSEVVLLFTILVMFGTAWLTSLAGLSLAIGAFAAGLILSETEYHAQIYSEVAPFRTLFSSLFFVAIGMLLDLKFVAEHPLPVLAVTAGVLVVKTAVVFLTAIPLKFTPRVSLQAGSYIAQIGEFSFVVLGVASKGTLIDESQFQYLIAAAAVTMAVTPFLMQIAPRLAWRAGTKFQWFGDAEQPKPNTGRPKPAVLVVGYGVNGKNVAHVLKDSGIYYEILETNPDIVRRAREAGELIHYGEVTRTEVLKQFEVAEFDGVVLAISDAAATRRAVSLLKGLNSGAHLIVRTRYVAEVEDLERLGADVVVPEEFETSLRMFSELLHHYRVPSHIIATQVDVVRGHSYGVLRAKASGDVIENLQELLLKRLVEAVPVTTSSSALGRTIFELGLAEEAGCAVISILRDGRPLRPPYASAVVQVDDLLVLYGNHADLNEAVRRITGKKSE